MILTGPPCKRMEEDMDTVWKGWWKQPSCDGLDHLLQLDEIWSEPKCTIHDTLNSKEHFYKGHCEDHKKCRVENT